MNTDIDLDAVEADWTTAPDVTVEESPETALAVRAHTLFQEKIVLAIDIKKRAQELGLVNGDWQPVPVTAENYDQAKVVKGMCVKARGDIKRLKEMANRNAIDWQRAVNTRAAQLTAEIEPFEAPFADGIKAINDEKARLKREKEEAEQQALEDAAREKLEAEQAAERQANEANRLRLEEENKALNERLANEQAQMNAERQRLAAENASQLAAQQKAFAEEAEKRKALERELAEHRAAKAAAEQAEQERRAAEHREQQRVATAEREQARLEAIKPDVDKIRAFGAAILKVKSPAVTSDEAKAVVERVVSDLRTIASALSEFGTV